MKIFSCTKKRRRRAGDHVSLDQADKRPAALFSTAGSHGIQVLAGPENAFVDVVFVHGLTGNRQNTWTHSNGTFWPRDLLPQKLPATRIMTYGYDADVLGIIQTAGSNTLRDHGKSLANDLALQRAMSNSVARPLVFVAHSLGGLVVEQALLIARGAAQDHLKALLESTFAIAFMGTPHMGSTKAEWTSILSRLSSILRQTNRNILSVLKPGSEILANVQQEFHTMLDDRGRNRGFHMEIYCFYEEVPVLGIGEVGPLSVPEVAKVWVTRISADDRDKIVPRHSAILPAYQNASLHGDHMSMTKFSDKNDSGYVRVCGVLWLWVSEMENKRHRNTEDDSQDGLRAEYGPIYSGGGSVFVGSNNAGRDITNVGLRS